MGDAKLTDTSIGTSSKMDTVEPGPSSNDTMYIDISGSLLYLATSRRDTVFSVGMCARFQAYLKESHVKDTKRILRYLKGKRDLVLFYSSEDSFDLMMYTGANYVGYLVDRKSTFRVTHFLSLSLISWGSKKKNLVVLLLLKLNMQKQPHIVLNFYR